MDWKHIATLPEKEQMRAWVENWKRIGPELEKMKRDDLRALTDEEAYRQATRLTRTPASPLWMEAARWESTGFVEQQRLFTKARFISQ